MKRITFLIMIVVFVLAGSSIFAQTDTTHKVKITQLSIMVIPRTNDGEDVRTILDQSSAKRIGIAKIKQAFDKRGFKTIDFVSRLNAAKTDQVFMSANPKDAKSLIIDNSGTDLSVEADIIFSQESPGVNSATVLLKCDDASSAVEVGDNADGCRRDNRITDTGALVAAALGDECLQNFLNSIQTTFDGWLINGRPVKLHVQPSASSSRNLFSMVSKTGKNITKTITDWLDENTVNGNYNPVGSSKLTLNVDDVKIRLLDNKNKNYKPLFFGNDLISYLSTVDINADSEVKNGTVYITIN